MKELIDIVYNDDWEIETPQGWKPFKGIAKYDKLECIKVTLENNDNIIVSLNHAFLDKNNEQILAKDCLNELIQTVNGTQKVINIEKVGLKHVFDILDVAGTHTFIANNIVNHNSHIIEEFWSSVYPIISSSKKSKVFIASTPNSTDNLFYELYKQAEEGKGWVYDKILWNEIPGRDEEWKEDQIASLGWDKFAQEFECEFRMVGESSINNEFFEKLKSKTVEPKHIFDDGQYLLWDIPRDDRIYVAGVDVSEGLSQDASVIQILDVTNLQNIIQVAQYHTNTMSPPEFLSKLYEVLEQWGKPLALIERNNQGAQVVDGLKIHYNYENIVSYGASEAGRRKEQLGMISHTNTKLKCITNMRYWINVLNVVQINDYKTVVDLKNFVKMPNGAWGAKSGEHDDRIMSLAWGLMILQNDICERFFEILQLDLNNKPQEIKLLDYGIKYYINPKSVYVDDRNNNSENVAPIVIPNFGGMDTSADVSELEMMGWERLY